MDPLTRGGKWPPSVTYIASCRITSHRFVRTYIRTHGQKLAAGSPASRWPFFHPLVPLARARPLMWDRARLDHAALRFFIARTSSLPYTRARATHPPKVVKACSQLPLWVFVGKAEKEDSVDNYLGNNPLYVNRHSPLRRHGETAFAYERIITRDGALEEPENAFGSLSDGIIRCIVCKEGKSNGGRENKRERDSILQGTRGGCEDFTDS